MVVHVSVYDWSFVSDDGDIGDICPSVETFVVIGNIIDGRCGPSLLACIGVDIDYFFTAAWVPASTLFCGCKLKILFCLHL